MPQLTKIDTTFTQDRRLALRFWEEGLDQPWNANEISDGTVQLLALFMALFDPRSPVLVVEEPENALHPWILRHFVELCREQGAKQIVLTTHSPILIDHVSPADLRLIWHRRGQSHFASIADLNPHVLELWKAGELRTFEIYDTGLVEEYLPEQYATSEGT